MYSVSLTEEDLRAINLWAESSKARGEFVSDHISTLRKIRKAINKFQKPHLTYGMLRTLILLELTGPIKGEQLSKMALRVMRSNPLDFTRRMKTLGLTDGTSVFVPSESGSKWGNKEWAFWITDFGLRVLHDHPDYEAPHQRMKSVVDELERELEIKRAKNVERIP